MKLFIFAALATVTSVVAECPDGCNGRGTCEQHDQCKCFRNYQGNDCSERTCPFGYAHVDSPKGDLDMSGGALSGPSVTIISGSDVYPLGTTEQYPDAQTDEGHFYMECSNRGLCNRKTGQCDCFDGYDGNSCQRASCPGGVAGSSEQCSGAGKCETLSAIAAASGTTYDLWDAEISRACVCDPGFTGADCSLRVCPSGVDPLYTGFMVYDAPTIRLACDDDSNVGGSFAITFYDKLGMGYQTTSLPVGAAATDIVAALEGLPNGVIEDGSVTASYASSTSSNYVIEIDFTNPGDLKDIEVHTSDVTCASSNLKTPVLGYRTRGEDADRFNVYAGDIAHVTQNSKTVYTKFGVDAAAIAAGSMIKIEDEIYVVDAIVADSSCAFCKGKITLTTNYLGATLALDTTTEGSHTIGHGGANVLGTTRIYSTCDVFSDAGSCDNVTAINAHSAPQVIQTTIDGLASPNARNVKLSNVGTRTAGDSVFLGDCEIQFEKNPSNGVWTPISDTHGCSATDSSVTYSLSTTPFCYETNEFPYGTFTKYTGATTSTGHTLTMASDDPSLFPTSHRVTVSLYGVGTIDQHPFKDTDQKPTTCGGTSVTYGSTVAVTATGTFSYEEGLYTFTVLGGYNAATSASFSDGELPANCYSSDNRVQLALGPDTYECGTSVGTVKAYHRSNELRSDHDISFLTPGDEVLVCVEALGCETNTVSSKDFTVSSGDAVTLLKNIYARGDGLQSDAIVYRISRAANKDTAVYVSECSGRGLCNDRDGTCTCFKGYAGDDCSSQDALCV